jgi:hypothetical protein
MSSPLQECASGNHRGGRDEHPQRDALGCPGAGAQDDAWEGAWMRILDAYDTLHRAGIACPDEERMLRLLRTAARRILLSAPTTSPDCWLVPATPRDVTACHLVAVGLLRRGSHARLWPWQAPVPGAGITVGAEWRTLLHRPVQGHDHDRMAASA